MPYGTLNVDKIVNDNGVTFAGLYGFKNRIINGGMVIDQRNAGASVTVNNASNNTFSVDRWQGAGETLDGVFTLQRSTVAPVGFTNSLLATVTTADASIGASQRYFVQQRVEGFNWADLGWGAADAQSATLSFWVRSSITGTYGGSMRNSAGNRSYPFTYAISAANTWEYKTVIVTGDTTGTWLSDNGIGVFVTLGLGVGSSLSGTAGSWAASSLWSATGATNWISTNGATFYITGVQLERGSTATSFDFRPYGTELMLCQRYYYQISPAASNSLFGLAFAASSTQAGMPISSPVTMRATPTLTQTGTASDYKLNIPGSTTCSSVPTLDGISNQQIQQVTFTVASGLTSATCVQPRSNSSTAYLGLSAEL